LGVNDDMVIWFRQRVGPEHRFIDYYSNSGEGLEHYARILKERADEHGYIYGIHHLPHDGDARRLSFKAKSVRQMFEEIGVKPIVVVPRIATEKSGIEASRGYLPKCWFDESRCAEGIRSSITTARNGTTSAGRGRTARAMTGRATDTRASRLLRSLTSRSRKTRTLTISTTRAARKWEGTDGQVAPD
jgi:hypothetical protein